MGRGAEPVFTTENTKDTEDKYLPSELSAV